jgi:hypothetical protein
MDKLTLPFLIVALGALVALLHSYALQHFLYWHLWWLDILMHFLGGLFVALIGLWFVRRFKLYGKIRSRNFLLFDVILFVFIISALWESFEFIFEITLLNGAQYAIDTIIDFLMGIIGATVAFYITHASPFFKKYFTFSNE